MPFELDISGFHSFQINTVTRDHDYCRTSLLQTPNKQSLFEQNGVQAIGSPSDTNSDWCKTAGMNVLDYMQAKNLATKFPALWSCSISAV